MLCTWARDYGVIGTGIDMSQLFTEQAKLRAEELGVADQVKFIHGDAAGYVSDEKVGAGSRPARGSPGESSALSSFWRRACAPEGSSSSASPTGGSYRRRKNIAKECLANSISDFLILPELLASFSHLGYDVVEMVLADQDGWDRYEAANGSPCADGLKPIPTTSSRKMFEPN